MKHYTTNRPPKELLDQSMEQLYIDVEGQVRLKSQEEQLYIDAEGQVRLKSSSIKLQRKQQQ